MAKNNNKKNKRTPGKNSNVFDLKSLQAIIKKELHKEQQVKCESLYTQVNLSSYLSSTAALRNANCFPLTPYTGYLTISQGGTDDQRVGNEIRVKRALLRMVLIPLPYDVNTNASPQPQTVDVNIFRVRSVNAAIANAQQIVDHQSGGGAFFDNGSTNIGNKGTYEDITSTINLETIIPYSRFQLKVGAAAYVNNTGAQHNYYDYENNDFHSVVIKEVDITKFVPETIKWQDTGVIPQTPTTYINFSPVCADGTSIAVADETSIRLFYTLTYEYYNA